MKLQLQINPKALNDPTRALVPHGVLMCPPVGEDFWFYRVAVAPDDSQAIVGFPKFGVIGVGFQREEDWNTNLPSGEDAVRIYDHIKHNKGSARIPRQRCIDAIRMINAAVHASHKAQAIDDLKAAIDHAGRLRVLGRFLRRTGDHEIAEAFDQLPEFHR